MWLDNVKWINFEEHKFAIKVFLVVGLLIHSAIEYFSAEVRFLNTGIFFLFYGLLFLLAWPVIKDMYRAFLDNIFLNVLILWAVLSILWTTNVLETSLALMSLLGMLLFAFYLVEKLSIEDVFELLVYFCLISILVNSIVLYFYPELSINRLPHKGIWQGMYWHKNAFGIVFYFSILILSLSIYFRVPMNRFALFIATVISFLFLYKSQSITAWFAAFIFLVLFIAKWLNTKKNIQWKFFIIIMFICSLIIIFNVEQVLHLFGKNTTLTNRTVIWVNVIEIIKQDIYVGKGYYGFWYDAQHGIKRFPTGLMSHNGFMEIMVFFGGIGFFLFFFMWARALFLSAKLFFSKQMSLGCVFPFIFLVVYSLQNTMDSLFFLKMNVFTVVFLYLIIYLNKGERRC